MTSQGVIVGLNAKIEYLLPFFYINLRLNTDLPITFFDFGMTSWGRDFCQKRGEVVSVDSSLFKNLDNSIASDIIKNSWFKKPLACQKAGYDINLWIDLDCLIKGSISEIFETIKNGKDLAIVREYEIQLKTSELNAFHIPVYNSGVFAFKKQAAFIENWINSACKYDLSVYGDQDILSFSIFDNPCKFEHLSPEYNYVLSSQDHDQHEMLIKNAFKEIPPLAIYNLSCEKAKIIHFAGRLKNQLLARLLYLQDLSFKKTSDETFETSTK
jgi:hypothetical protein